jgi:predicted metal-binding protein
VKCCFLGFVAKAKRFSGEGVNDMERVLNNLIEEVLALGATRAVIIDTEKIKFSENVRKLCEQNSCGFYKRNWMCPPTVGPVDELKKRFAEYKQGLLFQTVHQLEDSFDWEGMQDAKASHTKIFRQMVECMQNNSSLQEILPFNAGACTYCPKCSILDGEKCRFPDKAVASIESNGIDVMALVKDVGIPYNNGKNTVSYVSLILVK